MIQIVCQFVIVGVLALDMLLLFRSDCKQKTEEERFIGIVGTITSVATRAALYYGAGAMSRLW